MSLNEKIFYYALNDIDFLPNINISTNYKHWLSKEDAKRCLNCAKMHGKIWYINDEVTIDKPLHPNCRCEIETMQTIQAGTATINGENGADWYLKNEQHLPEYYLTKNEAKEMGYISWLGNFDEIAPGKMLTTGIYKNKNEHLPTAQGRVWYEADINYIGGFRGTDRIVFSNDDLIFVTYDHYNTFFEITD